MVLTKNFVYVYVCHNTPMTLNILNLHALYSIQNLSFYICEIGNVTQMGGHWGLHASIRVCLRIVATQKPFSLLGRESLQAT